MLLDGYVDGELDLVRSLEMEQHLKACRLCAIAHQNQLSLKSVIAGSSLSYSAPEGLHRRVMASLPVTDVVTDAPRRRSLPWFRGYLVPAAAFAVLVLFGWMAMRGVLRPAHDDFLAEEVVASHIRSMMVTHLEDVASTDRHTVKPWFNGKLDFSPTVTDLASSGFPLIGGRLDYLDHQPVAALVYRRQKHIINVFVWPATSSGSDSSRPVTMRGYHLVHWNEGGMSYWAVSDLNTMELGQFARLLQADNH
jgi:anti-sigma factor RsiW